MKTLIFYLVLTLFAGMAHAQQITQLKEARVGFAPLSSDVIRDGDSFSYNVAEAYTGEFESDPLLFMKNYFDIENLIAEVKENRYSTYQVTFRSSRGSLLAEFNRRGDLVKSNSKFKNILLPKELRHLVYRDHKGWEMTKNVHITRGRDGVVDQDFYKIHLVNGKERRNIVVQGLQKGSDLASN